MIPGYKPFFETPPPATTATLLQNKRGVAVVADVAAPPRFENTDTDALIERSAIREYDAGFPRDDANMAASRHYDRQRQSYGYAYPDRDPAIVEGVYVAYLQDWQPTGPGDVPAVPPNTNRNGDLWRRWWNRIEQTF